MRLTCCGLLPAYNPYMVSQGFLERVQTPYQAHEPCRLLQLHYISPSPQSHPTPRQKDFPLASMASEIQSTLPLFPSVSVTFSWRSFWRSSSTSWTSPHRRMAPYLSPVLHRPRALHVEGSQGCCPASADPGHTVREAGAFPTCKRQPVWGT